MQRIVLCHVDPKISIQFQSVVCETVKDDDRLRLLNEAWHALDRVQNDLPHTDRLDGVRQVEAEIDPPLIGTAVVNDRVCQYLRVRQDDHSSVGGSHLGGAQVNGQHRPIEALDADGFSHVKWLL